MMMMMTMMMTMMMMMMIMMNLCLKVYVNKEQTLSFTIIVRRTHVTFLSEKCCDVHHHHCRRHHKFCYTAAQRKLSSIVQIHKLYKK